MLFTVVFAACLSLLPRETYAQGVRVTLDMDKAQLGQVMSRIEQQTSYLFVYNEGLDLKQAVSVHAKELPLTAVLDQMLENTSIAYKISGTNIVLSPKQAADNAPVTVSGTVLDAQGQPIIGAAVIVKDTTLGTSTGVAGEYTLQIPPPRIFGCLGCQLFRL